MAGKSPTVEELKNLARESDRRAKIEINKNVVMSEVGRYCALKRPQELPELFLLLMEDMNRSSEWWDAKNNEWTINQWTDYLLERAENRKLRESA